MMDNQRAGPDDIAAAITEDRLVAALEYDPRLRHIRVHVCLMDLAGQHRDLTPQYVGVGRTDSGSETRKSSLR